MPKIIQYYCLGFIWKGGDPDNQLPRFITEGIWENGFEDKYKERVNTVAIGSRVAAKTTYTRKDYGRSISILEIHATGTVINNPKDGQTLHIKWDKPFEPFQLINRGGFRSTISRINNIQIIKEIFKNDSILMSAEVIPFYSNEEFIKDNHFFPCFVFKKVNWNDHGFETLYEMEYHQDKKKYDSIGSVKIFNKEENNGEIPSNFYSLEESYCSLGQTNRYYENLRNLLDKNTSNYYLNALNDIAINKSILPEFENEEGFKVSLIRNSEAQKALREGYKIYEGIEIDNTYKFTFSTQIGKATHKHVVSFDYSIESKLPFRIKVLIGKNGTGKTQYLAKLASTLSGLENQGEFSTKYLPSFSRVLAISYSLFDRFPKPKESKTFSYYYCGFQSTRGFLTENQIQERIKNALGILENSQRLQLFGKYLSTVLSDEIALEMLQDDFDKLNKKDFKLYDESGLSNYSSGQIIMILILAEVLAFITSESLLLFDEPETHLHPNSISLFINVINKILDRFNSYAIVSTHSPQIVQEIPSKDIIIFERIGNSPSQRGIDIETFGENLNTITERIFHTISHDEYYRNFFLEMSNEYNYDEIISLFDNNSLPLSLNAKIYLQSLFQK
jgi:predicted ATPase